MEEKYTAEHINRHSVIYAADTFCILKNKGDSFIKNEPPFYFIYLFIVIDLFCVYLNIGYRIYRILYLVGHMLYLNE